MKLISTLVIVLLISVVSVSASVALKQYQEVVISETIDATGRQYLTDIDGDGYLDVYFNTDTKIGWYSAQDAEIKSSIVKSSDNVVGRRYSIGQFDGDDQPDYVEATISDLATEQFLVYYLSSDGFSGADTVVLGTASGADMTYDPFGYPAYTVIGPYACDLNENGIDEVFTGYSYFDDGCISTYCVRESTAETYLSHEYGEVTVDSTVIAPLSYDQFTRLGQANIVFANRLNYGEVWGLGYWTNSPLEIAVYDTTARLGKSLLESNALCVAEDFDHSYNIEVSSVQINDISHGVAEPFLLARLHLTTSAYDCWEEQDELVSIDLTGNDSLPVIWREVAPDWANSDILFADTSSPGQVFLSDGEKLYQVRKETFEILDSSEPLNLSGHMVGYRPLAEGESPSLVLTDGNRVKFFHFDIVTDVDDDSDSPDGLPDDFVLAQNYPNPFNPTTEISFTLSHGAQVKLTVFNSLGQVVAELTNQFYSAGTHTVEWNGTDAEGRTVASGLYFYRLTTDGYSDTKKMLLLK